MIDEILELLAGNVPSWEKQAVLLEHDAVTMFGSTGTTPPPSTDFLDAFASMDFNPFQYHPDTRMCEQNQNHHQVTDQSDVIQMDDNTPPTPEILSSFFNYATSDQHQVTQHEVMQLPCGNQHQQQTTEAMNVVNNNQMYTPGPSSSILSNSGCVYSSDISSSSTFSDFPPTPSPGHSSGLSVTSPVFGQQSHKMNSVKATRSQLIKEGLKLTIQHKRRAKGLDSPSPQDLFAPCMSPEYTQDALTPEDEDRRRRRRERNKVAATKCRNKKKERTVRLAVESTTLESSNQQLKDEIEKLEEEKKSLLSLLRHHLPRCGQSQSPQPRSSCAHSSTNHCAPL